MAKKSKNIKLSQVDQNLAQEIANRRIILKEELAAIGVTKFNIKEREENAAMYYKELQNLEKSVNEKLTQLYGNGSVDLEKKEFIPS
tara:strand:- start:13 stop:273 length:261 start_codon:yes stop_codon:yes gene_type:complete